ncbi:MAG: nuclear transport factor 2 family protein [Ramlibacter sp.]
MDSASSKQAVITAWKAFATRDPAQISAVLTPDVRWNAPPGNATAKALNAGHELNHDDMVRFMSVEMDKLFVKDVKVTFNGLFADGPTVILEQRFQATLANGRPYDNDYCFVIEVKDGRIHRMREYMDTQRGFGAIFG